jgi:hypothetical protein
MKGHDNHDKPLNHRFETAMIATTPTTTNTITAISRFAGASMSPKSSGGVLRLTGRQSDTVWHKIQDS